MVRALASNQCDPNSNPGINAMWVEFVVGCLPCSERFFSGYSGFPLKNQHFQIPIRSGTHGHVSTSCYKLLSAPWVNKLQFTNLQFQFSSCNIFLLISLKQ